MHKLKRGNQPACLGNYDYSRHKWESLTEPDRNSIWHEIERMQGNRCAYCEKIFTQSSIKNRHIEHFFPISKAPHQAFAWDNLFGSCSGDYPDNQQTKSSKEKTCGNYKDHDNNPPKYEIGDLIKPDEEDPEYFFILLVMAR